MLKMSTFKSILQHLINDILPDLKHNAYDEFLYILRSIRCSLYF